MKTIEKIVIIAITPQKVYVITIVLVLIIYVPKFIVNLDGVRRGDRFCLDAVGKDTIGLDAVGGDSA